MFKERDVSSLQSLGFAIKGFITMNVQKAAKYSVKWAI